MAIIWKEMEMIFGKMYALFEREEEKWDFQCDNGKHFSKKDNLYN